MKSASGHLARWAARLQAAGAPEAVVSSWRTLRSAIASHQGLLREEGIGVEVNERDRVRVNARRVGLEAPAFADEADFRTFGVERCSTDRTVKVANEPGQNLDSVARQ
jgi:hypothetical protein